MIELEIAIYPDGDGSNTTDLGTKKIQIQKDKNKVHNWMVRSIDG